MEEPSVEKLKQSITELEQKLERVQAEFSSKSREYTDHIKHILLNILDVYEGMGRLISASEGQGFEKKASDFIQKRFELSRKKLMQILSREGVLQINSLGQSFNYEHHEIIDERYVEGIPPNTIVAVEREGYVIGGENLRMAQVVVSASIKPEKGSDGSNQDKGFESSSQPL